MKGDAKWLDRQRSHMAAVPAQPVSVCWDRKTWESRKISTFAKMPPVNAGLLDGQLAQRVKPPQL